MIKKQKLEFTWIGKENRGNREVVYSADFNYGEFATIKGIES
jgi:hypothetical protein